MKILILLLLMPSLGFSESLSSYVLDPDYRTAYTPPDKYLVNLSKDGGSVKELIKRIEAIGFYQSPSFKNEIGFLKEDGFYLNGEKVCKKGFGGALVDNYIPLDDDGWIKVQGKNFKMSGGTFCEQIGLYRSGLGEDSLSFFIAKNITDNYIEIEGKVKIYLKKKDFPNDSQIEKPTEIKVRKMAKEYSKFESYRKKVCKILKNGSSDEILEFLSSEKVKHVLIERKILKKGESLHKFHREDISKVCEYKNLWIRKGNVRSKYLSFEFKSKHFPQKYLDPSGENFSGRFSFSHRGGRWRLVLFGYDIETRKYPN